ncbi:response regulator [Desulfuromonas thiophila]|nr:response regulator [Desulfuromonas thiophila]
MKFKRPIHILLVEDNRADARLVEEALKDSKRPCELSVVDDGDRALAFLQARAPYGERRLPDLILLDLNLPARDGREVLREIKADPDLRRIPVVVLTTSDAERDIVEAYSHHANCYVSKPVDFDRFMELIQSICHFWFDIVCLP